MTYYMSLIHKGRFDEISHIYFQTGHTYMATDADFGQIEKSLRQSNYIFTPNCYEKIIKKCRSSNQCQFEVTMMQQEDFKDWEILIKKTTKRKCDILFSKCCYFRFSKKYWFGYGCGDTYQKYLENLDHKVCIAKGRSKSLQINFDLSTFEIPRKYLAPILLSPEKLADVQMLASEWVPPALKRQYWDRVLVQGGDRSNYTNTGNGQQPETSEIYDPDGNNDSADDNVNDAHEPDDLIFEVDFFDYN